MPPAQPELVDQRLGQPSGLGGDQDPVERRMLRQTEPVGVGLLDGRPGEGVARTGWPSPTRSAPAPARPRRPARSRSPGRRAGRWSSLSRCRRRAPGRRGEDPGASACCDRRGLRVRLAVADDSGRSWAALLRCASVRKSARCTAANAASSRSVSAVISVSVQPVCGLAATTPAAMEARSLRSVGRVSLERCRSVRGDTIVSGSTPFAHPWSEQSARCRDRRSS